MEVVEVQRDVLFVIHGLGVLSESFCQPLGNRSGRADVFRLGEESGCPDSVAFFEWFIQEVSIRVGSQLGFIFYEGASPACIYPFSILPLCILFRLAVGLTADAAVREASGHFDGSGTEVDLRIVLVQPGEPEYHALLAEAGDRKQNAFGVSVVGHDHVDDFADGSASSDVSMGATSLAASLFSSSVSSSSASMYQTSKRRSQSFVQCPVFPQRRQVLGVALAFQVASMSIGMGLPSDGLEWAKRAAGVA